MELVYWILFISYASYAYNRKCVVFSMPMLKEEGLDASYAGLILSCQNIAFSISKFLVGILSDRLNPYLIFTAGLLISGFSTLMFSSSSSVTTFCCLWFLNGLAQGCGWPPIAKILRQRASPTEFGTLWSFLQASNNFSGILGPFLSAFFIVNYGWRWSVFFAGFLTLCLCAFFFLSLSFISDSSNLKSQEKKESSEKKYEHISISTVFQDPYIFLLSMSFMVVFSARTTTVDWGQTYLMEEKHHSQYVASAFTSSVESGGLIGRLAGGYLTDWVIKRNSKTAKQDISWKPQQRMFVAVIFIFLSLISIHLFRFAVSETSSPLWIMSVGAFMGASYYAPIAILGIVAAECVPSNLSGTSNAIVALFGNIGATISGLPFSYIAKLYHWSTVFLLLEILTAVTLLILIRCRNLTAQIGKSKEE